MTFIEKAKRTLDQMAENEFLFQRSTDRWEAIGKFIKLMEAEAGGTIVSEETIHDLVKFGR